MPSTRTSVAPGLLQNSNAVSPARAPRDVRTPSVLTIAGSDSGGGAGIQADLKTFAAFRVHGLSAVTAVTAQNTHHVASIHRVPPAAVEQQLHAVFDDFRITAVKIGMLGSAATVSAVARVLREYLPLRIVLDPVLVSTSGTRLLPAKALTRLREELIPLADVLTPNLPEAAALLGLRATPANDLRDVARDLLLLGPRSVLLKGGHRPGARICDYLVDAHAVHMFGHARRPVVVHGTGCVLSAGIAAGLALGNSRLIAVQAAQRYLQRALANAYRAGTSQVLMLAATRQRK
jgi:hydroxymethylpyrimidine/phosphomethylpyrimidine kinase